MTALRLATAIENVHSPEEEQILALLDHLMPTLAHWRQGEHLREEERELAKRLPLLREEAERGAAAVKKCRKRATAIEQQLKRFQFQFRITFTIATLIALGSVLVQAGWTLAVLVGAAIVLFAGFWLKSKAGKAAEALSSAKNERTDAEASLTVVSTEILDAEARLGAITKELEARSDGFPEVVITRVSLPLSIEEIAGKKVLVDGAALHPTAKLKVVNFAAISDEMRAIDTAARRMSTIPPLLAPGNTPIEDPMTQLYGEESQLQDLVSSFTKNLGRLKEVSINVPMVPPNGTLGRRLKSTVVPPATASVGLRVRGSWASEALPGFIEAIRSGDPSGENIPGLMADVYGQLERTCLRFAQARVNSMNTIHSGITEVLSRANWVNRKYVCPRTVQSPQYIQDMLGVQIAQAHTLALDELLDRLQSDEVIRKRIQKKPDLIDQLENVYFSVEEFSHSAMTAEGAHVETAARPRLMDQQYAESLKQFRMTLTQIITGTTRPTLNLSPQAQLFYDPETQEWSSDVTPYTYTTPQVVKYGATTKVMYDLMVPIWEHLWTEKADFRKSELFRTNQAMINMSEKESEKLIEIGNQFRGDMRTNRENIYLIEADLRSKYDEILSFRDGMQRLNLVSERVMSQLSDDKLKELVIDQSPLETAGRYETSLALMPRLQAEMRGTASDPIDTIREPALLVESMNPGAMRLLGR